MRCLLGRDVNYSIIIKSSFCLRRTSLLNNNQTKKSMELNSFKRLWWQVWKQGMSHEQNCPLNKEWLCFNVVTKSLIPPFFGRDFIYRNDPFHPKNQYLKQLFWNRLNQCLRIRIFIQGLKILLILKMYVKTKLLVKEILNS